MRHNLPGLFPKNTFIPFHRPDIYVCFLAQGGASLHLCMTPHGPDTVRMTNKKKKYFFLGRSVSLII